MCFTCYDDPYRSNFASSLQIDCKNGSVNNMWGIILPYLVVPMLVFFFRQYLMGIPKDFLDAARVDGCTEYGIFFKIMIPLMKPSFAAMGIYQGMQSWNNFLWPMIVTNSIDKITLPVGLQSLLSAIWKQLWHPDSRIMFRNYSDFGIIRLFPEIFYWRYDSWRSKRLKIFKYGGKSKWSRQEW